jgi:Tol biopolymer transport system component
VSLAIGSRVGPYEVVSILGSGGMGVVYRAHDSRLGRDVAIKISSERFTERFEREARAVAALNHPNICTLHDIGPDYLVMELVEGETLADVLAQRGAQGLPTDEALTIGRQIAAALEAAHEKGIVHRDLKPGNIKLTGDGVVKVLDFGLAKIGQAPDGSIGSDQNRLTQSPTIGATQVGVVMGTAAYMSPEQARGRAVDKRADIWSFGVVLYEMLNGRRPFEGEDVSTIVAAVIQTEPPWDAVPPRMQRLLKKCLEKDPKRRLRDIGDAWELVAEATELPRTSSRWAMTGWLAATAFGVAAALALWAPWRRTAAPTDRPLVRLEVELGSDVALEPLGQPTPSSLAISPDGTRLVYVASVAGGPSKLLIRRLDQPSATELAGTDGARGPFFSPDSGWVVFYDGSRLKKISVEGGATVPMVERGIVAGGTWLDNGDLIFATGLTAGLLRAPADGGAATEILKLGAGELFYAMPQLLPGGRHVLITVYGTPPNVDRASIDVVSLTDSSRKTIARGGTSARYLPSGHVVYTNRNTMFAIPFDVEALETRGTPVPVLTDVAYDLAAGLAQYDVSRDGTLVYRGGSGSGRDLAIVQSVDENGRLTVLYPKPSTHATPPRIAPDGKRIAMVLREGAAQDVWVYDTQRGSSTRLTFGEAAFASPAWSPDGKFLVFGSIGGGMFWARADGGGRAERLLPSMDKSIVFPMSFTSDGSRLLYYEVVGTSQIFTVPLELSDGVKAGKPERYLTSQFADTFPTFSRDGRWILYQSNDAGRDEIYVRPFPLSGSGQGGKWQISTGGGRSPQWLPNGREILYQSGDQVMSVEYTVQGDTFVPGKPRVWRDKLGTALAFDLAPDGEHVVVLTPTIGGDVAPPEHSVMFLQNFFDELRRRVPVGK